MLQTFRGMGRGKGFAVESRVSGLEDRHLCLALKPKVLAILSTLVDRGYVEQDELVRVVKPLQLRLSTEEESRELESLRARTQALEAELRLERASQQFLERDVADLESRLENERSSRDWAELRAAESAYRFEQNRKSLGRIVAAYRESIQSLRQLQDQLQGTEYAEEVIRHVTRNTEQAAQLVQELRALQSVQSVTRRGPDQAR